MLLYRMEISITSKEWTLPFVKILSRHYSGITVFSYPKIVRSEKQDGTDLWKLSAFLLEHFPKQVVPVAPVTRERQ